MTSGPAGSDPAFDVVDLDARRRARRQALRDASLHAVVVLPHTEGELAAVLGHLEDLLLDDVDDDEPVVDADPEAVDAVGRLASYVGGADRGEPAVQPVAPDGRYELVPLHTLTIGRKDLSRILGAIAGLPPASAEAMRSRCGGDQEAARFVATAQRLAALLSLPWDDDVDVLQARLNLTAAASPARVVLSAEEYAAYERVTRRILATWHAGDSLAPFLYHGG